VVQDRTWYRQYCMSYPSHYDANHTKQIQRVDPIPRSAVDLKLFQFAMCRGGIIPSFDGIALAFISSMVIFP